MHKAKHVLNHTMLAQTGNGGNNFASWQERKPFHRSWNDQTLQLSGVTLETRKIGRDM